MSKNSTLIITLDKLSAKSKTDFKKLSNAISRLEVELLQADIDNDNNTRKFINKKIKVFKEIQLIMRKISIDIHTMLENQNTKFPAYTTTHWVKMFHTCKLIQNNNIVANSYLGRYRELLDDFR